LWDAVSADLHRRAGHLETAQQHRERALAAAPTDAVRERLRRRLTAGNVQPAARIQSREE
jgi:predicted RNA polymerase sigma factor